MEEVDLSQTSWSVAYGMAVSHESFARITGVSQETSGAFGKLGQALGDLGKTMTPRIVKNQNRDRYEIEGGSVEWRKEYKGVWIDELNDMDTGEFSPAAMGGLRAIAEQAIRELSEEATKAILADALEQARVIKEMESLANSIAKDQIFQAELDDSLAAFLNSGSF